MKKCKECKVEILDDMVSCPLCSSVLEHVEGAGKTGTYPDVKASSRKLAFIIRLYLFLAIITEAALVAVNYLWFPRIWWSAISGISIFYFYVT